MNQIGVSGNRLPRQAAVVTPTPKMPYLSILAAAGLAGLLTSVAILVAFSPSPAVTPTIVPDEYETPGRHNIILNDTARADSKLGTLYLFEDCPRFLELHEKYRGGLSMSIKNCTGDPGLVTVRENNGKLILSFVWSGASHIAVNGWHETYTNATGVVTYESWGGMEIATMDWVAGTWKSTDGILVEHQLDQTMGNAMIIVVYNVPMPEPIPEFSDVLWVVAGMMVVVILARRARR